MKAFFEVSSALQILLLILSQLTVIGLASCCIIVFHRRYFNSKRLWISFCLLLLNIPLYVLMQLDSRITANGEVAGLPIPYMALLPIVLSSAGYALWTALCETGRQKTINNSSIQESFDNLPTGVCFFNAEGLPVLCNRAMHRFSFAVSGKDVQYISDLLECTEETFSPMEGTVKDGSLFFLPDGTVWKLDQRSFTYENGTAYTQFTVADITELHHRRRELSKENDRLRETQLELQRLSANVVAATREEEILNTKMRVHDEMGRCLVEARKYLREDTEGSIPTEVVRSWQRAVSMLKYNNDSAEEDMLTQLRKSCASVGLTLVQRGELPTQENAYLLICAIRECVTNAVRYAGAKELYAEFSETDREISVAVSNDGKQPHQDIVEGGGLSTLRRRVEREGGVMAVRSLPAFRLCVSIPKEGIL